MAINYKLRDEIKYLIVCLYNPSGSAEETQYTTSSLWDYILDCGWQLEQGEKVKRFPYHITPSLADAEREKEKFKSMISLLRKDRISSDENLSKPSDHPSDRTADHAFIRRSVPRGDIRTAANPVVTLPSNRKKQKGLG